MKSVSDDMGIVWSLGKEVKIYLDNASDIHSNVKHGKVNISNNEYKAYLLNAETKDKEYIGKICGIAEDVNNKSYIIVVCDTNINMEYDEIKGKISEVEKNDTLRYRCSFEKSAGAVIYRKNEMEREYLIIYSKKNFYGFPKGHIEYGESELEAALREVQEEVGLKVDIKSNFKRSISYMIGDTPIRKNVVFFLAECPQDAEISIQEEEINECFFVKYNEVKQYLNDELMQIVNDAEEQLRKI